MSLNPWDTYDGNGRPLAPNPATVPSGSGSEMGSYCECGDYITGRPCKCREPNPVHTGDIMNGFNAANEPSLADLPLTRTNGELRLRGFHPYQMVSLLQMQPFNAAHITHAASELVYIFTEADKLGKTLVSKEMLDKYLNVLERLLHSSQELGLMVLHSKVNLAIQNAKSGAQSGSSIKYDGMTTHETVLHSLNNEQHVYIPGNMSLYFNDKDPFTPVVTSKFPDAEYDIKEASKSLALDRHTACVFHLLRVLECGILKMCGTLSYTIPANATWHVLLTGCKPLAQSKGASLLVDAIDNLMVIKDAWRNPVMHARRFVFNNDDALAIYHLVRNFMIQLEPMV